MNNINDLLKKFNKLMGGHPKAEIGTFKNWAGLETIPNLLVVSPANLGEVKKVVVAARKLKLRVRCTGAGHSWSDLFPDEKNVLMKTENLRKVQPVWNSEMTQVESVRVLCGTTLGDLVEQEKAHNFNMPCNVIIPFPSYGGVVAPACHGVGWDFKSVSDYVISVSIVNSDAVLQKYTMAEDPDMMKAVQCNLGMFGIMYEIELKVMPKKIATVINDFDLTVGDVFYDKANLKKLVTSYDSVEIYWFPFQSYVPFHSEDWKAKNDKTWVRQINIGDSAPPTPVRHVPATSAPDTTTLFHHGPPVLPRLSFPIMKHHYKHEPHQEDLVDAIHYLPSWVIHEKVHDMEWAFDVKDDFSTVTTACQQVIALVEKYAADEEYPLSMLMEMRWMGYSDAYLCPAIVGNPSAPNKGSGHTFYLEVLAQANSKGWPKFCNEVAQLWRSIPGSKPPRFHWAKEWGFIDGIDEYARKTYATEIAKFKQYLEASGADPDRMFMNKRLEGIFYPEGEAGEGEPVFKKRRTSKRQ